MFTYYFFFFRLRIKYSSGLRFFFKWLNLASDYIKKNVAKTWNCQQSLADSEAETSDPIQFLRPHFNSLFSPIFNFCFEHNTVRNPWAPVNLVKDFKHFLRTENSRENHEKIVGPKMDKQISFCFFKYKTG